MNLASIPVAKREVASARARHTLSTLVFASSVCVGMLAVRVTWAHNLRFSWLLWNLVLAWIPLSLAFLIRQMRPTTGWRRFCFGAALVVWVLFYPNAFYLVTDLIHMDKFGTDQVIRWYDLLMTISFACAGIFIGCLALYLLHLFVRQRFGWRSGWAFALGMLALGSFGIYLGRVLRLNSWDVVTRPFKLWVRISSLAHPASMLEAMAFSVTFFFFSLAIYTFVVSIARLHETES